MKKVITLCLLSLMVNFSGQSQSATTDYLKGYFVTKATLAVNTNFDIADSVTDKFVSQYRNNLKRLFTWALKDMKLNGEQDSFIMFNLKSHNLSDNYVSGIMDIDVLFINKKNKDIPYKVRIDRKRVGKNITVNYELSECEKVINHAVAQMSIVENNEHECTLNIEVGVKLRMPYSMMTKKQYRENIEWRFVRLLENLGNEMKKQK